MAVDTWESTINGLPYGLYVYLVDTDKTGSSVIGASGDNVFSCFYAPYVRPEDLEYTRIPYDTVRFGKVTEVRPELTTEPMVSRIKAIKKGSRFFGVRPQIYEAPFSFGGQRDWRKESKLHTYPYSYITLFDGINEPMNLKPQYCSGTHLDIGVKNSLDDKLTTSLFVQNYKGDTHGRFEGLVIGANLELPTTSSNYANFISRTRSTLLQNSKNIQENFIVNQNVAENNYDTARDTSLLSGGVSGLGNILSGNFGGLLGTGANLLSSAITANNNLSNSRMINSMNKNLAMKSLVASVADSKTVPNTLISKGSDIMYGLRNMGKALKFFRFRQREEYMEVLGDYFAMYGYAQNRLMSINLRSRVYYNYIKTKEVNILTSSIPNIYLEKLKAIYNNGTTVWHVDNPNVFPLNYDNDNTEVDKV